MESLVSIDVSHLPKVCFALQQNAIPLIRQLTARNDSEEELLDVRCTVSATPTFFEDHELRFASLAPGKDYTINDLDTHLITADLKGYLIQ